MGSIYRKEIKILKSEFPDQILCVESFGKDNYFTAMFYAKLLIGNTSSGIIEAASFKTVIDSISSLFKLAILELYGTPSTTYKGSLEEEIEPKPRIRTAGEEPG